MGGDQAQDFSVQIPLGPILNVSLFFDSSLNVVTGGGLLKVNH